MTHLSDLTRRMLHGGDPKVHHVFATGDRGLAEIARLLPIDADEKDLEAELARLMSVWWPERSVGVLARRFAEAFVVAASRPSPTGPEGDEDPIARMIVCGERLMGDWTP